VSPLKRGNHKDNLNSDPLLNSGPTNSENPIGHLTSHVAEPIHTRCCIAGGGPAGIMLAFLLARAGVDVLVLEKHEDFLRDFRGDTIHPSTLELIYELGILEEFLKRPHEQLTSISAQVGRQSVTLGDFTHLPTHCKFLALMPQWDFLNFVVEQARQYSSFRLITGAEVTDLIEENGTIVGLRAKTKQGEVEVRADLIVGADGRHSIVRQRAKMDVRDMGAPMDVMWMRLSRREADPAQTFGHVEPGKMLVLINRESYWQAAFVIPKDAATEVRERGLPSFQREIAEIEPFLRDRVQELHDWNQVSLLTVKVDRLMKWSRPGLICIGDAAHAMSPIGGVGINLAIQDAVAAANILSPKLRVGTPSAEDLEAVQKRRNFPTVATQWLQLAIQKRVILRVLGGTRQLSLPWPLKLLQWFPYLRRFPARLVGMGFRPEHVVPLRAKRASSEVHRAA
jgi:2-polyprenyl-6-methoxyphenol hydroxylase-like FAD-dependent oxidoreductase